MPTFSIASVLLISLFVAVRTTVLLRRRAIKPSLAMWLFFTVAVAGSMATYLADGDYSPWDNILNTADLFLCSYMTVAILVWGDASTRFNRFDLGCLAGIVVILAYWALSGRHAASHLLIQLILVIAYFPVVRRLWTARENTESFAVWAALLAAPLFSLLSSKGILAAVYAGRTIVCTGLLMVLMARAQRRGRQRV